MSDPRSWLFVPADSDKKIAKALECPADAIIFDLEEAYGIEIEMNTVEAWSNLKTVQDMIEAVRGLIEKKTS